MRQSRLPIVSQVNGPCAGAAVGVALAGDIVIAARSAYFYEPFVGIALVPDAGNTLFLPRIIGRIRAAPMMFLGDRIGAEEALSWGLVWRVFDDADLLAEAEKIAATLVARTPGAIAATKRLVTAAADFGMDGQLDLERDLQGIAGRTTEMKEAIAAFFTKKQAG
jgi:2-(1,2-epoxy-1,2-dihydrophenyl)acetyl-CoA isomerase